MDLFGKIKRSIKDPKKAVNRTYLRIDELAGRKVFGNTVGFKHNLTGSLKIDKTIDSDLQSKNPELYCLKTKQFTLFQNSYTPSLIAAIKKKYNQLMNNKELS